MGRGEEGGEEGGGDNTNQHAKSYAELCSRLSVTRHGHYYHHYRLTASQKLITIPCGLTFCDGKAMSMISPVKCNEQILHSRLDKCVLCSSGQCEKGVEQQKYSTVLCSPPHASFQLLCGRVDGQAGSLARNVHSNVIYRSDSRNVEGIAALNCSQIWGHPKY